MTHLDDDTIYALAADGGESPDATGDAHLRTCDICRGRWETAVALRRAVRAAPRTIDPPANLWPSIRASIAARPVRHHRRWRLAAAFLLAAAATTTLVVVRRPTAQHSNQFPDVRPALMPPFPAIRGVSDSAAASADARVERELLSELELRRGELRPETATQIQTNLRTIDAAIADVRAELARDPDNATLRQVLTEAYQHKVDLMALIGNAS
jgi:hypothetical protein